MIESTWNIFKQKEPDQERIIIAFRHQRKKLCVGRFKHLVDPEDNSITKDIVTGYGNCHTMHPEDRWVYLPKLEIETKVTYE